MCARRRSSNDAPSPSIHSVGATSRPCAPGRSVRSKSGPRRAISFCEIASPYPRTPGAPPHSARLRLMRIGPAAWDRAVIRAVCVLSDRGLASCSVRVTTGLPSMYSVCSSRLSPRPVGTTSSFSASHRVPVTAHAAPSTAGGRATVAGASRDVVWMWTEEPDVEVGLGERNTKAINAISATSSRNRVMASNDNRTQLIF